MPTVSRTFLVRAQPEAVIDYLKDFSHATEWDPGTESCERLDSGEVGVGSRFRNVSKIAGVSTELTYEIQKLTPGSVVIRGENDSATSTDTMTAVAQRGGSEVTYEAVIEMKGVAKVAEPVMKLLFERIGSETEENLVEVLNRLA